MEINVLWIDDEPNDAFMDKAEKKGLMITNRENVDAGIEEILSPASSFDAIILDANCISHKSDNVKLPEVSALQYALQKLSANKISLPWFVYSGGGFEGENAISIMVKGCERTYDNKAYYKKPLEMNLLFDKILEVIPKKVEFQIKQKYAELLSWYPNPKELMEILTFIEEDKSNNPDVFNKIRKELDWVMGTCYDCGLLQEPYKGSNLSECSKFLGEDIMEKNDFVPLHIQRSLHSASVVCNEGSHRLKIDKCVKEGTAPYLVQSTVYEFLNILSWIKTLPQTKEGKNILENKVIRALANATNSDNSDRKDLILQHKKEKFVVEKDENGVFHAGKCFLLDRDAEEFLGVEVSLDGIIRNKKETKGDYPLFAKKIKVEN